MAYTIYSILATITSPVFIVCIAILYGISYITGMSYELVSVVINIYLQGLLVMLSSLFVLRGAIRGKGKVGIICSVLYVIANVLLYAAIINHYGFDTSEAFKRCYAELMNISYSIELKYEFAEYQLNNWIPKSMDSVVPTIYMIINVLFFVYGFIGIILANYFVGKRLYKKAKVKEDRII